MKIDLTKLVGFDLEIADSMNPEDGYVDQHISCAALALTSPLDGITPVEFFSNPLYMTESDCRQLIERMMELDDDGYTIVTWNGSNFDFKALAKQSGWHAHCTRLNINHLDLMFMFFAHKGYPIALQKACEAMRLGGKKKEVRLNDGSILSDFSGKDAPELWRKGERDAVLSYLAEDAKLLISVTREIARSGTLNWITQRNKFMSFRVEQFMSVGEAAQVPEPNVSWMTNPIPRSKFISWMEEDPENA